MNLPVSVLEQLPPVDEALADKLLDAELAANDAKIVVLDDDPTGVQTVHDVSVYTDGSKDSIRAGFAEANRVFYILTNSRGMTVSETTRLHREIGKNLTAVARETGKNFLLISRSDSTLRGHYPLETALLREAMEADGRQVDGEILCPFFKEGGRFTLGNVHYVRQGQELIPAAQTEFAADKTFGYRHSALPDYIAEKTGGAYPAESVTCISLDALRALDFDGIVRQLLGVSHFNKVCVNAADDCDLKVFAVALYRAMAKGKTFLFRSAAGLVKVLGGISDIPLLTRADMVTRETANGGVVIVGSHTHKTTEQLNRLLELGCTVPIAFDSDRVLDGSEALEAEVRRCVALEEAAIRSGKVAVCYTCRKLLSLENDTKESALQRSIQISHAVQSLIGRLHIAPAFVIAKGGITSSDVGTKALGVKRADVMGQICPGVPVWKIGEESRFPGMPYIIFPGNTGDENSLRHAVEILTV